MVRVLIGRVALLELVPTVLARALESFPVPVTTLDALHLASMDFLRSQGQDVRLATYDEKLGHAAKTLGIPLEQL